MAHQSLQFLRNMSVRKRTTFFTRALVLLTICGLLVVQRIYQQPLLRSLSTVQDVLRSGNVTLDGACSSEAQVGDLTRSCSTLDGLDSTTHIESSSTPQPSRASQVSISSSIHDCSTKPGNPVLFEKTAAIVADIMNSPHESDHRLTCPALNTSRYSHLVRPDSTNHLPKFFFALDLYQSIHILEQLLSSIIEAIRFLGPQNCILSVVEGRSSDGTYEILRSLRKEMDTLGVKYHLQCVEVDPKAPDQDRILALARLRNLVLQPLTEYPELYDPDTRIIFSNDIALCPEDILELIHQGAVLKADMTCGFDWNGEFFYDVWIGRTMTGDLFFEIPQSQSWDFAKNLFWNHEQSRSSYSEGRPFQVFSCWNGLVNIVAKPFLEGRIKFRSSLEGECRLGEPVHLCKDLWKLGYGKIAVIPSINVAYKLEEAMEAKKQHGTVSSWVEQEDTTTNTMQWSRKPPPQIKCFVDWSHPSWELWDQGLLDTMAPETHLLS